MKLLHDTTDIREIATPCLVVCVLDDSPLAPGLAAVNDAGDGFVQAMLDSGDIATGAGKTTMIHRPAGVAAERLLVVGLGKTAKLTLSRFNDACQKAGKLLRDHPVTHCHVCLHDIEVEGIATRTLLRQSAIALHHGNYLYTVTKQLKEDAPAPLEQAVFLASPELQSAVDEAQGFASGFEKAKKLGDLPPNICTPAYLAQEAAAIAKSYEGVELEVLEESRMAELGMDALLGVSRGSTHDAKLIVLHYRGAAESEKPIALVGKGITFDSGGLSLKSGENMMQMKYDMCGAAGVIGAFVACARLKLNINVVCIVAAVENMPDGDAYRPGDVLTSMSGKTIEVLNTDAEGRLVLCDALTYS